MDRSHIVRAKNPLIPIYLFVEAAILILIELPARLFDPAFENVLLYSAIVINAAVAILRFFPYRKGRREDLIPAALLITVLGDLFLTLLGNRFYLLGVLCFCIVEIIYAIYLNSPTGSIVIRFALCVVLSVIASFTNRISFLNIAAVVNISVLAVNVFDAWYAKQLNPGLLYKIGITLFLGCDLCVGLSNLLSGVISTILWRLIWMFYLPSQVLITLSYIHIRRKHG